MRLIQSPNSTPGKPRLVEFFRSGAAKVPELPDESELKLDLTTFQTRLEKTCRVCWNTIRGEFPGDTICMFGLETDSDRVILNALLDSEEAIKRESRNRPCQCVIDVNHLAGDTEKGNRWQQELK